MVLDRLQKLSSCTPAMAYIISFFILNVIVFIVTSTILEKQYCFNLDLFDIIKAVFSFILFVTILMLLCMYGYKRTAWGVVLIPNILIFLFTILMVVVVLQKKENQKREEKKEKIINK
jgi:amino acid transporter